MMLNMNLTFSHSAQRRCKLNTFGVNCSESVKVCDVANPCVHGTCKDEGGVATCSCPEGE